MKSTLFELNNNQLSCKKLDRAQVAKYEYQILLEIPILNAYSIEYATVTVNNSTTGVTIDDIEDNTIKIDSEYQIDDDSQIYVEIYYQGIRDYGALFPWISNMKFRERLGQFYEEMTKTFENQIWLAFSLSVAAVIEGMLHAKLDFPTENNTLEKLLKRAKTTDIITIKEFEILSKARQNRNLVHSNKYESDYVTKKDCLDMRVTIDRLVKKFCE
ncbi:hypothetical protein ACH0B5_07275 [Ureibacillus sp. 179-F W5.1 NHS]|uniref:hypothetical protein n=1 Tax=Ureibacillus sp. 179-F W5.1 NHS TaxID=3374297 RepID=UPI0038799BC7